MIARLFATLVALFPSAALAQRQPVMFLVPAYFYPSRAGSDWDRLTAAAAAGVPVVAIVNPASGPGERADANYTRVLTAFRAAGGRVLGYVPSGYGGRRVNPTSSCKPSNAAGGYSVEDLVACASRYRAFYDIDGIFIDELGAENAVADEATTVAFYTRLFDGLKAIGPHWSIVGNPGTVVSERYLRRGREGGADALVTFEDKSELYAMSQPAQYTDRLAADRFGAIVIETAPDFDFAAFLVEAANRNTGYIYATDALLPNPYDRLPATWDAQMQALLAHNAEAAK